MNFKFVNPKSVEWLLPTWAISHYQAAKMVEHALGIYRRAGNRWHQDKQLDFWIEIKEEGQGWSVRLAKPEDESTIGLLGSLVIDRPLFQVIVPLNNMLKGLACPKDTHTLYIHGFDVECPLLYIGITKRRWVDRLSQHQSSARSGSPFLFHQALRKHNGVKVLHRVLLTGMSHDDIMKMEEIFVAKLSLYPLGLNMIPGGFAGLEYLHRLGIAARGAADRDEAIERLVTERTIGSRPNPLCAARWKGDQDFVNRVICGHSGRLTVEQVTAIKLMVAFGQSVPAIAQAMTIDLFRVSRVANDKAYRRVA